MLQRNTIILYKGQEMQRLVTCPLIQLHKVQSMAWFSQQARAEPSAASEDKCVSFSIPEGSLLLSSVEVLLSLANLQF